MNQKNVIVITILIVILSGSVVYFTLIKKPSPDQSQNTQQQLINNTPPQRLTTSNESSNWKTYQNKKYGFEIGYPSSFIFHDSQSMPDSWVITKFRDGRIIKPVDCSGFMKQPDEISFSWSIFDRQSQEYSDVNMVKGIDKRYNTSKYVPISIGNKSLKVQESIPGMCGTGDEFIWMEPSGKYIVVFNINPSNTTLIDEYRAIIASFKLF